MTIQATDQEIVQRVQKRLGSRLTQEWFTHLDLAHETRSDSKQRVASVAIADQDAINTPFLRSHTLSRCQCHQRA